MPAQKTAEPRRQEVTKETRRKIRRGVRVATSSRWKMQKRHTGRRSRSLRHLRDRSEEAAAALSLASATLPESASRTAQNLPVQHLADVASDDRRLCFSTPFKVVC